MSLVENVTDMNDYREQRGQASDQTGVLVLTGDDAFLTAIRSSSTAYRDAVQITTLEKIKPLFTELSVGVIVIDAAFAGALVQQVAQALKEKLSTLAILVIGDREKEDLLMDMVNSGDAYRLLLKPLTPGRLRIAMDACVKHHKQLAEPDTQAAVVSLTDAEFAEQETPVQSESLGVESTASEPDEAQAESSSNRGAIIGLAVIVLLLGVAGWMFLAPGEDGIVSRSLNESATGAGAGDAASASNILRGKSVEELIAEARDARDARMIFDPAGSNALELYFQATVAMPADRGLQQEFAAVINEAMVMAQSALIERRAKDASAALNRIAQVDPGNSRLSFMNAQLEQMHFSNAVDTARTSIQASRFDEAQRAIDEAQNLKASDKSELALVITELEAARNNLAAKANARLASGQLVSPKEDSARYYYEVMLKQDPGNAIAKQGLGIVASLLVSKARTEIESNRLNSGERMLREAREIDAGNRELAAVSKLLDDKRTRIAAQEKRKAQQEAEERRRAAARAKARAAEEQKADDPAEIVLAAPVELAPELRGRLVPIRELERTRNVLPKYPQSAENLRLTGWVNVEFTVDTDGSTRDIVVQDSEPGDVFDKSVISAVQSWRFEPVEKDGVALKQRTGVRINFGVQNWKTGKLDVYED